MRAGGRLQAKLKGKGQRLRETGRGKKRENKLTKRKRPAVLEAESEE